ncbi:hypothetical protein ACOME3_004913 [Neoechinorhynchus agilis]
MANILAVAIIDTLTTLTYVCDQMFITKRIDSISIGRPVLYPKDLAMIVSSTKSPREAVEILMFKQQFHVDLKDYHFPSIF